MAVTHQKRFKLNKAKNTLHKNLVKILEKPRSVHTLNIYLKLIFKELTICK